MPGPGAPTPTLPGQVGTGGLLTEAMKKGAVNMLPVFSAEAITAFLSGLPILGLAGMLASDKIASFEVNEYDAE
ncbi:hypothetical protein HNQ80_004110 [Anaerosolibacter carboniphilus]|uniref:Uncharacterized protein n=1 Tax=Anaerosolibacter carboniphilus TaxID=1417629 RepID=A0A841KX83_9FIRM|nr:hypothetical protein [Anaerosolibacter carboniphilus]MBB6217973.1 hypothetical protein [Anaerosolibacter carboniphilus]